jgi:hypothetical protein
MASVHRKSRTRRHLTPLEWPSTYDDEIDGYRWGLAPGPDEADVKFAAESFNDDGHAHVDDGPPADDPIWDVWAEEHAAQQRLENGYGL